MHTNQAAASLYKKENQNGLCTCHTKPCMVTTSHKDRRRQCSGRCLCLGKGVNRAPPKSVNHLREGLQIEEDLKGVPHICLAQLHHAIPQCCLCPALHLHDICMCQISARICPHLPGSALPCHHPSALSLPCSAPAHHPPSIAFQSKCLTATRACPSSSAVCSRLLRQLEIYSTGFGNWWHLLRGGCKELAVSFDHREARKVHLLAHCCDVCQQAGSLGCVRYSILVNCVKIKRLQMP